MFLRRIIGTGYFDQQAGCFRSVMYEAMPSGLQYKTKNRIEKF